MNDPRNPEYPGDQVGRLDDDPTAGDFDPYFPGDQKPKKITPVVVTAPDKSPQLSSSPEEEFARGFRAERQASRWKVGGFRHRPGQAKKKHN